MTTLSYILLLAPIVEHFQIACILLSLVAGGLGIAYIVYMCGGLTYDTPKDTSKKWPVICLTVAFLFAIGAGLMPDRKTVYMVAGVETINKFSQTEVAKELGDSGMSIVKDITTIIHTYTLDSVKEAKKSKHRDDDEY
jgi:hypothetical protein